MIRTCPERHPGTNLRPTTWPPLSAARAGGIAGLSVPLPDGPGELRPKPLDGCKRRQAFERIVVVEVAWNTHHGSPKPTGRMG